MTRIARIPRIARLALLAAAGFTALLSASEAEAAPQWVSRGITLPRHDWSFDLGLGIGHEHLPNPYRDWLGPGFNFEMGVGITQYLELGLRGGIRFGDDGRFTKADEYGRLFDRQTFGTYTSTVADPEFRIRGALIKGEVVELALEGRATLPIEDNSNFGAMFGVPLLFHLGHVVRLDTGAYVPIVFDKPNTNVDFSAPLDVWIQATPRLWLGPMTGVRIHNNNRDADVSAGFGLGYQFTHWLDLKTMFLVPGINHTEGARNFGAGVGVQMRIE